MHKIDGSYRVSYNKTRRIYHLPLYPIEKHSSFLTESHPKRKIMFDFSRSEFPNCSSLLRQAGIHYGSGGRYQEWSWKQSPEQSPKPPPLSGPDTNTPTPDKRFFLIHCQQHNCTFNPTTQISPPFIKSCKLHLHCVSV